MSSYTVRETFFRPPVEHSREQGSIPAPLHNGLQRLVRLGGEATAFIPIRSLQYLAVVGREEILFVDGLGGYAHQNGSGGRLIRIAWRPAMGRDSLSAPVSCEMVYYFGDLAEIRRRLPGELGRALQRVLSKERGEDIKLTREGLVMPFRHRPGGLAG